MITLIKSFELQNHLCSLLDEITSNINYNQWNRKITENHLKSKSIPSIEDEVIEIDSSKDAGIDMDKLYEFYVHICAVRCELDQKIYEAKHNSNMQYDVMMSTNKKKLHLLQSLNNLFVIEPREQKQTATGYTFNVEGNQTTYRYQQTTKIEPTVDQKKVKKLIRQLKSEVDDMSKKIVMAQMTIEVDFDAEDAYVDMNFKEAFETFLDKYPQISI